MANKPSSFDAWTTNMAMLAPGQVRVVDPLHDNFDFISAWIDTVTNGDVNLASDKMTLANIGTALEAGTTPAPAITSGDTVSSALRKLEWQALYAPRNGSTLVDESVTVPKLANYAQALGASTQTSTSSLYSSGSPTERESTKTAEYTCQKGETLMVMGVLSAETGVDNDYDRRLYGKLQYSTSNGAAWYDIANTATYMACPGGGNLSYRTQIVGFIATSSTAGTKYCFRLYAKAYGNNFSETTLGISKVINLGG